jgi:putative tricarboxylic transport membrane protein
MKVADLIISAAFFLLGVWILWQSTMLPQFSVFGPGPEFVPNLAGGLLILLSGLLFVSTARKAELTPADFWPNRSGWYRVGVMVVALFLYTALLEVVGYLLLTFLYSSFMLFALAKYRWYMKLGLAVFITFIFYQTFVGILQVPAPKGIFDL